MSQTYQTSVSLVGVGGSAPYAFTIVTGSNTTLPATISGAVLTVDASALEPGLYTVEVVIHDQTGNSTNKVLSVHVLDQNTFAILNRDLSYEPAVLPYAATVALLSVGGAGAITWSLVPSVTTLPGAAVNGSLLSYTLTGFGQWTVGLRATDAVGNTTTTVIEVAVVVSAVVSVVDGHALIEVDATEDQVGTHTFTLTVVDSAATAKSSTFQYTVDAELSEVDLPNATVNHFWGAGDTSTVVYPITGDLSGFAIGEGSSISAANGLSVEIDTDSNSLIIAGPPTSFGNAEIDVPIAILQGSTQVATITRQFTLVSHSGTSALGAMTCSTRPYVVGELVGLNPLRPYFNSPSIFKSQGATVSIATGSTLPLGLSLDAVTGLIYGTVLAADVPTSTLLHLDANGNTVGTVTVVWTILHGQFLLMDGLPDGELQAAYTGSISTSSAAPLTGVSVFRGLVPDGVLFGISSDKTSVTLSGIPTVAGYFDLWLEVTNSNGQVAYLRKRLVIDYVAPLSILTDAMERLVTGRSFTQTISAVGGTAPYIWSVAGGSLPSGLTLNPNSGVLSGTSTSTVYRETITLLVTDARGVAASRSFLFALNNTLTVTTSALPLVVPGQIFQYAVEAEGGSGAYAWALGPGSAALPGGITLSSAGILSGATGLQSYSANINLQVTDAANNVASHTFLLAIGVTSGLSIDTEGIGPLVRGQAYQGQLSVLGNGTAPFFWSVTPDTPNPLPEGLFLSIGDVSDGGATSTLSGVTTASLLYDSVKVQVVDRNGNSATAFLLLNTYSSLAITTATLPQATVTGSYAVTLAAGGANPTFAWSLDPTSAPLPSGLSLSSAGVLSGTPTAATDTFLVVRVTDALGDHATKSLELVAKASTLAITSASLPQATAGVAYGATLAASGGQPAYTWSVSPISPSRLPQGLSLNPATGIISGTTVAAGFAETITFRVTDAIGVYREASFPVTVIAALKLAAGPDWVNGTRLGYLGLVSRGDVSGINPRPNRSFNVVATNVVSTSAAAISLGVPPGFTATVLSLSGGSALIGLTGPFASGTVGDNSFAFSIEDSGVNASATFLWRVYSEGGIGVVPATGSLPVLYS